MIDKANAPTILLARLAKLSPGQHLILQPFKKDRTVEFRKLSEKQYEVKVDGFSKQELLVESSKLKKIVKSLLKNEFPRSNKIRLYSE